MIISQQSTYIVGTCSFIKANAVAITSFVMMNTYLSIIFPPYRMQPVRHSQSPYARGQI